MPRRTVTTDLAPKSSATARPSSAPDFESADVVDLFTSLERALASVTGDTATEPPTRRVARWARTTGDGI